MKKRRILILTQVLAIYTATMAQGAIQWLDAPPPAPTKSMVIYFTGTDCDLCLEADEDVWGDPRIEAAAAAHTTVKLINGTAAFTGLVKQHGILVIPTVLLLQDGKETIRLQRNVSREDHLKLLAGEIPAPPPPAESRVTASADDKTGDASSPSLDLRHVNVNASTTSLEVRLRLEGPVLADRIGAYNLFLDLDEDSNTGYTGSVPEGADALVQGLTLYTFSGATASEWGWTQVGMATHSVAGNELTYTVDSSVIGLTSPARLRLWAGTQNDQWQDEDWAPEKAPLSLGNKTPQQPAATSPPKEQTTAAGKKWEFTDPKGDSGDPAADLVNIQATVQGDQVHFDLKTAEPSGANPLYVFIDADASPSTGFGDNMRNGADFMIEGGTLYRFSGAQSTEWGWHPLGPIDQKPSGNWIRKSVSRSRVGIAAGAPVNFWAMASDAAWAPKDHAPDNGAYTLQGDK